MPWLLVLTFMLALAAVIGLHAAASAKGPSVTGRTLDPAGYPVPGVSVSATPEAGGIITRTMTGADGTYQLESLPADTYRIDFELLGFEVTRRNHVRVSQNATASGDATLWPSSVCECVAVVDTTEYHRRVGQVVDESGRPLPYARLEIVGPRSPEVAYAGSDGQFGARVPVSETWSLTASDSGFGPVKQQVSGTGDVPIVFRLAYIGTTGVADLERFSRGCGCPGGFVWPRSR